MSEETFSGFSSSVSTSDGTFHYPFSSNTISNSCIETNRNQGVDNKKKLCPAIPGNKYVIDDYIGKGSFGQVYKAKHSDSLKSVAIKFINDKNAQQFSMEHHILSMLKRKSSFPQLIEIGSDENDKYIVMELLGPNLTKIRKSLFGLRFAPELVIKIGICVLEALTIVHNLGYTHSDVKPSNVCVGCDSTIRLCLIDFGLSTKINTNSLISRFHGSRKYCSINAHQHLPQAPSDDIASLFYSMLELSEGVLPWDRLPNTNNICFQKQSLTAKSAFKYQSTNLWMFYVKGYEECSSRYQIEHELLSLLLKNCLADPSCPGITAEEWIPFTHSQ